MNRSVQHTPVVPESHPGVTLKPMSPMTPRPQVPAQKPNPQVPVGSQSPAALQWPVLGPAVGPTQTGGVA
jgi:hypothetical protein